MKRQEGGGANFSLDITSAFLHVIVVEPCTVDSPQEWFLQVDCEWWFRGEVAAIVWRSGRMHGSDSQRRIQPALLQNARGFENIDVFAGGEKNWQNWSCTVSTVVRDVLRLGRCNEGSRSARKP